MQFKEQEQFKQNKTVNISYKWFNYWWLSKEQPHFSLAWAYLLKITDGCKFQ